MINREGLDKARLLRELAGPAALMKGMSALKTRYRPLVCPLDLVLEHINSGAKVYDVGCGAGALMYLAIRVRGAQLAHGCDVSEEVVRASNALSHKLAGFRIIRLAVNETPPNLAGYDTVTVVDVLHHVRPSDQVQFIGRLVKNMAPGAKLIILDIDADKRFGAWCNQVHDLLLARQWVHPMKPNDVVSAISLAGAKVESCVHRRTLWYPHYVVLARKADVFDRPRIGVGPSAGQSVRCQQLRDI